MNPQTIAETLLVKRMAFEHEKEIRLIYFENQRSQSDLYFYPFDPHEMIDQIMIDPRMTEGDADALKAEIQSRTFFKGTILRSLLYAPPKGFILPIS